MHLQFSTSWSSKLHPHFYILCWRSGVLLVAGIFVNLWMTFLHERQTLVEAITESLSNVENILSKTSSGRSLIVAILISFKFKSFPFSHMSLWTKGSFYLWRCCMSILQPMKINLKGLNFIILHQVHENKGELNYGNRKQLNIQTTSHAFLFLLLWPQFLRHKKLHQWFWLHLLETSAYFLLQPLRLM